jgi:hypothetical protein
VKAPENQRNIQCDPQLESSRIAGVLCDFSNRSHCPPVCFGMGGVPLGNEFAVVTDKDAYATIEIQFPSLCSDGWQFTKMSRELALAGRS